MSFGFSSFDLGQINGKEDIVVLNGDGAFGSAAENIKSKVYGKNKVPLQKPTL